LTVRRISLAVDRLDRKLPLRHTNLCCQPE
jgi:hypothetical protein